MTQCRLKFTITSDWHVGDGRQGGAYADAIALKDIHHLPYIPGKSIRGLLREAFEIAVENNWFDTDTNGLVSLLFGCADTAGGTSQGIMAVSSAKLSEPESRFLQQTPGATSCLYRVIYATAIDPLSGVAKETSLRSMEVVVPMTLYADIQLNEYHPALAENPEIATRFISWLKQAITLINELGAKRHRGFGQVTVNVEGV